MFFLLKIRPIPAPKQRPNDIHRPILFVLFPIKIPAIRPIPAPIDILSSIIFNLLVKFTNFALVFV